MKGSAKGFAKMRDKNEPLIAAVYESVGAKVQRLSDKGVPDLLVGWRGMTLLVEVKAPLGPKGGGSGRQLTDDQQSWWKSWTGATPILVRTPEDALRALGMTIAAQSGDAGIWTYCPLDHICAGTDAACPRHEHHERGTYPRRLK